MTQQRKKPRWVRWVVLAFIGVWCLDWALGATGRYWMRDAAGETRQQVEARSLQEQYEMVGVRLDELWERVTEVQRAIDPGEWENLNIGAMGWGGYAPNPIRGATNSNSYFLNTGKALKGPEYRGDQEDLEPFTRFADAQGWEHTSFSFVTASLTEYGAVAHTPDGWRFRYSVRTNGYYTLDIDSPTYWGPVKVMQRERHEREFDRGPEWSLPGIHAEFPAWDAPRAAPRSTEPPRV